MLKAENYSDSNTKLETGKNKGVQIYQGDLTNAYVRNVTKNMLSHCGIKLFEKKKKRLTRHEVQNVLKSRQPVSARVMIF